MKCKVGFCGEEADGDLCEPHKRQWNNSAELNTYLSRPEEGIEVAVREYFEFLACFIRRIEAEERNSVKEVSP